MGGETVKRIVWLTVTVAAVAACATSPLGRKQFKMMPEGQMAQMGASSFAQMSQQIPQSSDSKVNRYVSCVANGITQQVSGKFAGRTWEVRVFEDDTPNAFALPGGKIGVHTGLLKVAKNQSQLAAVLGHEVAHVLAGHANERISANFATQTAMVLASAASDPNNPSHGQLLAMLGMGAQVGILLPYSRTHESEADLLGLDLMAKAGFDPRESVELWRNMASAGGGQPPEFLSTHPSHRTRIRDLQKRITIAQPLYDLARAAGRAPDCS